MLFRSGLGNGRKPDVGLRPFPKPTSGLLSPLSLSLLNTLLQSVASVLMSTTATRLSLGHRLLVRLSDICYQPVCHQPICYRSVCQTSATSTSVRYLLPVHLSDICYQYICQTSATSLSATSLSTTSLSATIASVRCLPPDYLSASATSQIYL